MPDQSIDALRIGREQIAAAAAVGFNAAQPFFHFQASILRLMAHNFESLARNYERSVEAFTIPAEEQHDQTREAAE